MLLHGLLGSKSNWKNITNNRLLKDDLNFLKIDLRNHGFSNHSDSMTYKEMSIDVFESIYSNFIRNNIFQKFYLLGHSMGGKVSILFALMYPHLLLGLIILDTSPEDYLDDKTIFYEMKYISEFLYNYNIKNKSKELIISELENEFGLDMAYLISSNIIIKQDLLLNKWKINIKSIYNNINNILSWKDVDLKYIGPVCIINGKNSYKFSFESYKKYFPNIKPSDVNCIEDAGHWVHIDKPTEVVNVIRKFIKLENEKNREDNCL